MKIIFTLIYISILNILLSPLDTVHDIYAEKNIMSAASVTSAEWRSYLGFSIPQADACENVRLYIRTSGYLSGAKFTAKIYEHDTDSEYDLVGEVTITINLLGTGSAEWTAPWINDITVSLNKNIQPFDITNAGNPSYIFEVYEEGGSSILNTSGVLNVVDEANPETPVLTMPENKIIFRQSSYNINFAWQSISEDACQSPIVFYRIDVSKTSDFSSLEWSEETNETRITHQFDVGVYYWRVAARDLAGNPANFTDADWSEVRGFKVGASKIDVRINPESFNNKVCKQECAVQLGAALEYYDGWEFKWLPLVDKIINVQININGEWKNITDDISTTEQKTDTEGYGSVYYLPLRDVPLGDYSFMCSYSGDDDYSNCSAFATLSIIRSASEACRLIFPNVPEPNNIPIILVHGDFAENSEPNCAWDTLIAFIYRNQEAFQNYDVYLWKQDTGIPIGFNGTTGSAKELTEYIQPVLLSHPGRKVILIGHSRGGLVCRSYMNYNDQGENVLGLIALGTPHHGAPLAVIDWSLMILNNQYGDVATNLFDNSFYNIMRIGDLNLRWDNMDSVIVNPITRYINTIVSKDGILMLTERDLNKQSAAEDTTIIYSDMIKNYFGNLTELNANEKYFDKIITYGAYDNYLGDNGNLISLLSSLPTLLSLSQGVVISELHDPIGILCELLAAFTEGLTNRAVNFYANDGLVPLQSALFSNISGRISFAQKNPAEMVTPKNINERKQVKLQRVFNNSNGIYDHIHLIDIYTNNNYWQTLTSDINSFYEFEITDPDSGDNWYVGEIKTINWSSQNIYGNINILLSTDNGENFNVTLASNIANDNTEPVVVPDYISSSCKIKIVLANDSGKFSISKGVISLSKRERKKGDFDNNGSIQAIDASLILQSVVGLVNKPAAGSDDSLACDVDRNGMIGAYDAYLILYFIVNGEFPESIIPKQIIADNLYLGKISIDDNSIKIPVILKNAYNVSSISMSLNIDEKYYLVDNVTSFIPVDWMMTYKFQGSKLNIAFAGFKTLTKGIFAEVVLKFKSIPTVHKINGIAVVNDINEIRLNDKELDLIPNKYELYQNYPNPFNPVTKIKYDIPDLDQKSDLVELKIFDILGNEVKTLVNKQQNAGIYEVIFDGSKISSGIYFYRLRCNSFTSIKKMVITK